MAENNTNNMIFEDISSSSVKVAKKQNQISNFTNQIYKNLANVVKTIAFILAFLIIIAGFLAAFLLFSKTLFSIVLSFAAIVVFTGIAACVFFPIYAIGQILCQNEEILKELKK